MRKRVLGADLEHRGKSTYKVLKWEQARRKKTALRLLIEAESGRKDRRTGSTLS